MNSLPPKNPVKIKRLGPGLRRRRLDLGLTLEEVVAETRIQKHQLQAIENDSYQGLDHSVHTLGFIRRYANLLKLDPREVADVYLQQRGALSRVSSRLSPQRVKRTLVGSRLLGWLVFALVVGTTIAYLVWQLAILAAPPRLSLSQPQENQLVYGNSITVSGQTTPGAEVKINGQLVYVDEAGGFSHNLELGEGLNIIRAEASNSRGRVSSIERSVLVRPPQL